MENSKSSMKIIGSGCIFELEVATMDDFGEVANDVIQWGQKRRGNFIHIMLVSLNFDSLKSFLVAYLCQTKLEALNDR